MDISIPNNNNLISPLSNLGFPYFLPIKILFSLSKTTLTCLEKGNYFNLPSSFIFVIPIIGVEVVSTSVIDSTIVDVATFSDVSTVSDIATFSDVATVSDVVVVEA